MHRLIEQSKATKAQADKILRESHILEILKEYGEVKIGGSYALDVMLRADLDLFVITKKHDWEKVIKIYDQLMRSKYFREFDFVNWVDFEDKSIDPMKGYYFQPWVPIDDQLWKMDVWLVTPDQYNGSQSTDRFKELLDKETDDSKRIAILEIKEAMKQGKKYIKGVDGKLIYQAVLEHGIVDAESFKRFLGSQVT